MHAIDGDAMELLSNLEKFEGEVAERLGSLMNRVRNNIIRLLLHTLILDSMKHASIIRALLDAAQGVHIAEADKRILKEELSRHISEEEAMLGKVKDVAEKVEDVDVKAILNQISLEEERHHKSLKQLLSILDRVDQVGDDEWWKYMNEWANFST
ncbi:MAG: hypothetical protein QW569_03070 [Candidatus Bathyarchaeia archaeon]|nr:hypothetical protein [Candidatus Bathyarchaeota archaeon]